MVPVYFQLYKLAKKKKSNPWLSVKGERKRPVKFKAELEEFINVVTWVYSILSHETINCTSQLNTISVKYMLLFIPEVSFIPYVTHSSSQCRI